MRITFALLLLLLLLGGLGTPAVQGQAGENSSARQTFQHQLRSAQRIRLEIPAGRIEGTYLKTDQDAVLLGNGEEHRIPLAEVSALWVRGHATRTGAIAGGVFGGLAGAAFLNIISRVVCESSSCHTAGNTLLGGALGAGGGALLGAAIGAVIPKWHRKYP